MLATSPINKQQRRKSLERKKEEKEHRRNPVARELRSARFHQKNHNSNEKGGGRNLIRELIYIEEEYDNEFRERIYH